MKNVCLAISILILTVANGMAQNPLSHPKKMYRNAEGRLFANKNQAMYLMLSTSPGTSGDAEQLKSESGPKYANPFYFDSEGLNTIRTPSQVDPESKELVYPIQDVVFEIYADGMAPKTTVKFLNAPKHLKNDSSYFGRNLKVAFSAYDKTSGCENTYYSINGANFQAYNDTLSFEKEGSYHLKYYSVDNVGNVEELTQKLFVVDRAAPTVNWKMQGDVSGDVVSARSKIELIAFDGESGVEKIVYQLNDNKVQTYTQPIALSAINSGNHEFKFWAIDNVGNRSDLNNSASGNVGTSATSFSFIIDYDPPEAFASIINDSYQGKNLFVSERSLCQLDAKDNQLVVDRIMFGGSKLEIKELYEEPFAFNADKTSQTIYFQSYDMVENRSKVGQLAVVMDKEAPMTGIDFKGPQFFTRDTLFINQSTEIKLFAEDDGSGVQSTMFSTNKSEFKEGKTLKLKDEGWYVLSFYSSDNVNNKEVYKTSEICVDNEGPDVFINFSIKPTRQESINGEDINIYPPFVKLYIGATDKHCGTKSIYYSIDGGPKKNYSSNGSPADLELFKEEKVYSVEVEAKDKLGNTKLKTLNFKIAKN